MFGRLNVPKTPLLLLCFCMGLLGAFAQSETSPSVSDEQKAKTEMALQLQVKNDFTVKMLDQAKEAMTYKRDGRAMIVTDPAFRKELDQKAAVERFATEKEWLYQNDPAEFQRLSDVINAGQTDGGVVSKERFSQEDYNAMSDARKAYIDAHPETYTVGNSTK